MTTAITMACQYTIGLLILAGIFPTILAENYNVTKPVKMAVILEPPFVMRDAKGNYSGLLIDVLTAAGIHPHQIDTVVEGRYGWEESPGQWAGVIGQLADGKYDLAVAPFSIRSARSKVVTFTQPVIHAGFKVLYKAPGEWTPEKKLMSTLFLPFSPGLWFLVLLMGVLVSAAFCLIHRFNPYEDPLSPPDKIVETSWTDNFLYTFGALMGQNNRVGYRSVSARLLSVVWWLFALMTVAAYMAGLVIILFRENPHVHSVPFQSVDEMVHQSKVQILGVKNSATYNYMASHKGYLEAKVYEMWERNPETLLVDSTATALKMMMEGDGQYAIFMDEATADWLASQEPCDKMVIGEPVGDKRFGYACGKGSAVCEELNHVILDLQETGQMEKFREKWFWSGCHKNAEYVYGGETYLDTFGQGGPDLLTPGTLTIERFAGALVVLVVGLVLAFLVMVAEICYARRKGNVRLVVGNSRGDDIQRIHDSGFLCERDG